MLVPERLKKPFYDENGTAILQRDSSGQVFSKIHSLVDPIKAAFNNSDEWHVGHVSLCDSVKIPKACGPRNEQDCYDLTAIASLGSKIKKGNAIIASFPLTVVVSNPKKDTAQISEVKTRGLSAMQRSPEFVGRTFFEPLAVGDGRLLVGRFGGSNIAWTDEGGIIRNGNYDVVYSVYEGGSSCDASKWQNLFPISHAPYHRAVNSRYDFARQPFRDPTGQIIPDGVELGITYPWMDHEAKNLVFTTISDMLFYTTKDGQIKSRFPVACANANCTNPMPSSKPELAEIESAGATRGFTIMGAWTRGKMRLLDGLINRADFGLRTQPGAFRSIRIYRESDNSPVWIKVGANRDNTAIPNLDGYPGNTTFFDSITDRFFYSKNFKPRLSRDVVWTGSVGTMTDDISFDEGLDNRLLLLADMNAALQFFPGQTQFTYFNGNPNNGNPSSEIRLQNVASSGPAYGVVVGGRVEPVALGGRFGRGVYLDSDVSHLKFRFDAAVASSDLYMGLFVSPRGVGGKRQVVRFPDGSSLSIDRGNIVIRSKLNAKDFSETTIGLPPELFVNQRWVHLGVAIKQVSRSSNSPFQMDIYIDGMVIARQTFATRPLKIGSGDLVIGGGFRGWYDEVRVMNAIPNSEEACNFAYGTIGQIEATRSSNAAQDNWLRTASRYPEFSHGLIRSELISAGVQSASSDRFVCLVNHNSRFGWSTSLPKPAAIKSYLRSTILMKAPEFRASLPRPDSTRNGFCLSCHEPAHPVPGLRITGPLSLVANRPMKNDRRKQPTQPIRILGGNLPAGLLGNHPHVWLPAQGGSVYQYMFPD
jgi:hypothetical protein